MKVDGWQFLKTQPNLHYSFNHFFIYISFNKIDNESPMPTQQYFCLLLSALSFLLFKRHKKTRLILESGLFYD